MAITKIFGLYKISNFFGKYYAQHLSENQSGKVDVLVGAFMMMKRDLYLKVGGFDENCFMYSDDIDLSYMIQKLGMENFYFHETSVIHYKGESTKKSSVNYVFVFYNAMIIFAKKHFNNKNALAFSFLIKLAIYFRAGLAIVKRFLEQIFHLKRIPKGHIYL